MKKLNNKGMSTIELLVSFVLLVILVVSIYGTVESYKNKQNIEGYNLEIMTYKNLLTKTIQDDLVKIGLVDAKVTHSKEDPSSGQLSDDYTIDLLLRDSSKRTLKVHRVVANEYGVGTPSQTCDGKNDEFIISYGMPDDLIDYPLPQVGSGLNSQNCVIQDLRMNFVDIGVKDSVFHFYIGLYHPDFSTKISINIVSPLNFR